MVLGLNVRKLLKPFTDTYRSLLGLNGGAELEEAKSTIAELQDGIHNARVGANNASAALSEICARIQTLVGHLETLAQPVTAAEQDGFLTLKLPTGASCELSISTGATQDFYHSLVCRNAAFDPNWYFLNAWVKSGDVFFDLGANIGTISIPAAINGATVHAFELLDWNVQHLVKSVQKNGLNRVSVIIGALSDSDDFLGIGGVSAWGTVVPDALVSIPSVVIDTYIGCKNIPVVHAMKLDVEGSELRALQGAVGLIGKDHPDIMVECNAWACGNHGYSYRDLLRFLQAHGYDLYRLQDRKLCPSTSTSMQELFFVDYFATTKASAEITERSGWPIADLTHEDIVLNIIDNERYGDMHKHYVLTMMSTLPAAVLADARVAPALEAWKAMSDAQIASILQRGSA